MTITIEDIKPALATVALIIGGFLAVESRYEQRGAAFKAETGAKIYTLNIEVARLTSTRFIYEAREQVLSESGEELSLQDRNRRDQISREIESAKEESKRLQSLIAVE